MQETVIRDVTRTRILRTIFQYFLKFLDGPPKLHLDVRYGYDYFKDESKFNF